MKLSEIIISLPDIRLIPYEFYNKYQIPVMIVRTSIQGVTTIPTGIGVSQNYWYYIKKLNPLHRTIIMMTDWRQK